MGRKVFRTGNSLAVSLPKEAISALGLSDGEKVEVKVDPRRRRILITPTIARGEVDETFAKQVAAFINRYRPALEELARR